MTEVTPADIAATKPDCRGGAAVLAQAMNVAIGKAKLPSGRAFMLGIMAGMLIATGATFMLLTKGDTTLSFAPSQVLGGVAFSLGLLCVIVAGAELFTGNCLMVCAAADGKISWLDVLKNWVVVYLGNLVGSLIIVAILIGGNFAGMNGGAVGNAMINVAYGKIALSPAVIFFRGIMCNWLVCLAVWMGFAGRTVIDKIFTTNLIYQRPELLTRSYYANVDLSKYIALLIDHLNHNVSLHDLLIPTDRINRILEKHRAALAEGKN